MATSGGGLHIHQTLCASDYLPNGEPLIASQSLACNIAEHMFACRAESRSTAHLLAASHTGRKVRIAARVIHLSRQQQ